MGSFHKTSSAFVMEFIVIMVGRWILLVLSGELHLRYSRGPSAVFGKGLRIMICECFHFIIVSNCLATARI